jgi:hypothetical protein
MWNETCSRSETADSSGGELILTVEFRQSPRLLLAVARMGSPTGGPS